MSNISMLYSDIVKYIADTPAHLTDFPLLINDIFYDLKYTSSYDIDIVSSGDIIDESFFYTRIFKNLNSNIKNLIFITNSFVLNEPEDTIGDYSYYSGIITPEVPYLYEMSSHPIYYPNRVIIFDPKYQIEISSDQLPIAVYEVNMGARTAFLSCEKEKMFKWLMETDRPCLEFKTK